jgi:hypothetical protein
MIIYRPHKGSLADALAEAKEFRTEEEMKSYIYEDWKKSHMELGFKSAPFEIEDIVIDDEISDGNCCGWHDTRYVCVKRMWKDIYDCPQCIGMCATDYERK